MPSPRPLAAAAADLRPIDSGITSVLPAGSDNAEIIETIPARRAPMIPASAPRV